MGGATATVERKLQAVVFVQSGALEVETPSATVLLAAGDAMTLPLGLSRSYSAPHGLATAFVVRGA